MTKSNDELRLRSETIGRFKDQVEGVSHDDNDIYEFAINILDQDLLRVLINKKQAWRDNRDKFDCEGMPYVSTKEFQDIVKKQTTLNAHNSAHNDEWTMLRYAVSNAEDPDIASTKLVKWLIQYVDNEEGGDVTQIQMGGEQGAGKTQFAFLLAELWLMQNPKGRILTNVKNVDDTIHISGRDDLEDWLEDNEGTPFIIVLDELNKHASGSDHEKVLNQLFSLVTYLRKKKGNYIIMGHTGTDIHPWIRELCDYIHKKSEKVAQVYKNIDDSGEPEDHIKTIRGVPKSTLDPDTFDESTWEWGDEQTRICIGSNADGDRCGTVTRADWGEEPDLFCDSHQHQTEPHEDVSNGELVNTEFEDFFDEDGQSESETSEEEDQSPVEEEGDTSTQDKNSQSESIEEDQQKESTNESGNDDAMQNSRVSDTSQDSQPSTSSNLDDVPQEYWEEIEEQTGGLYTKANVDSLERVKQLLTDSSRQELEAELTDSTE